ncbi:MAG: 1-acyl-sn-glycerol-3-phosphate acyltransferase [Lentisphaeria bacterium]|nr:1-acyl-sn-glycerol-3-phosphate acyltransferase [Lentisphaeria bacterium]
MAFLFPTEFSNDSYDTPEDFPRSLWEYAVLGSRLSFYIRNFYVFARVGTIAKQGRLTAERQADYSLKNIRIMESCGGRLHLRGLNNLSAFEEPAVIISNHMSLLETAVMHAFLRPRRDFCFVIKRSLLDVPFFGHIMRNLECIPVDRVNPRDDFKTVMEVGKQRLEQGKSVIIFPQSTRSAVFDAAQFNTIGVKLAKHAGAPIIPLALRTDFLENGKMVKDLGPIRRKNPVWFEFGEPILKVSGSGKEEHAQIVDFIQKRVIEWGGKVAEEV